MKRLIVAVFKHETNTFSPLPTPLEAFGRYNPKPGPVYGADAVATYRGTNTPAAAYIDLVEGEGEEPIFAIAGSATPGGPVTAPAFEHFAKTICDAVATGCDGLFLDLHNRELDGALGGRALSWEAIPLAVLYLYCSRDPVRYQRVFWLALIEQGAAIVANVYHWGAGDFSFESVFIPIVVATALGLLVFLHLFQPREPEEATSPPSPGSGIGPAASESL